MQRKNRQVRPSGICQRGAWSFSFEEGKNFICINCRQHTNAIHMQSTHTHTSFGLFNTLQLLFTTAEKKQLKTSPLPLHSRLHFVLHIKEWRVRAALLSYSATVKSRAHSERRRRRGLCNLPNRQKPSTTNAVARLKSFAVWNALTAPAYCVNCEKSSR